MRSTDIHVVACTRDVAQHALCAGDTGSMPIRSTSTSLA